MRLDKLWVVAKKDLAEFRTNKYVMYSILLMPLLLATVLPVIYLSAFVMMPPATQALDVGTEGISTQIIDQVVVNGTYADTSFLRCELATWSRATADSRRRTHQLPGQDSYIGNSTSTAQPFSTPTIKADDFGFHAQRLGRCERRQ